MMPVVRMAVPQASAALARFTILDLSRVRAGPTCVRQLADWGANVIKVEIPQHLEPGDPAGGPRQASKVPTSTATLGKAATFLRSTAAMLAPGSSATIAWPRRAKGSVAFPVPAPISRIRPPRGIRLRATTSSTSDSGYGGRAASYSSALRSNDVRPASSIPVTASGRLAREKACSRDHGRADGAVQELVGALVAHLTGRRDTDPGTRAGDPWPDRRCRRSPDRPPPRNARPAPSRQCRAPTARRERRRRPR